MCWTGVAGRRSDHPGGARVQGRSRAELERKHPAGLLAALNETANDKDIADAVEFALALQRSEVDAARKQSLAGARAFAVPERVSKVEPFKDEIHRLLRDDPKLPGVRVRELSEPGFDGGKTILDDYLREVRPIFP